MNKSSFQHHLVLAAQLKRLFDDAGLCFENVLASDEVVLFGSRANDQGSATSDWDLLVIGGRKPRVPANVDLVFVDDTTLNSPRFLNSELAHTVAEYGCWIKGTGAAVQRLGPVSAAASFKARKLVFHLKSLLRVWSILNDHFRRKWARLTRRDIQRLLLLKAGKAIPPTPSLDQAQLDLDAFGHYAATTLANQGEEKLARLILELWALPGVSTRHDAQLSVSLRNGGVFLAGMHDCWFVKWGRVSVDSALNWLYDPCRRGRTAWFRSDFCE